MKLVRPKFNDTSSIVKYLNSTIGSDRAVLRTYANGIRFVLSAHTIFSIDTDTELDYVPIWSTLDEIIQDRG